MTKEEGSSEKHFHPPLSSTRQASQYRTPNIGRPFISCPTQALWAGGERYTPMQFHTDSFLLHKPSYSWYMLIAMQCSYPVSMLTIKNVLCKCTVYMLNKWLSFYKWGSCAAIRLSFNPKDASRLCLTPPPPYAEPHIILGQEIWGWGPFFSSHGNFPMMKTWHGMVKEEKVQSSCFPPFLAIHGYLWVLNLPRDPTQFFFFIKRQYTLS